MFRRGLIGKLPTFNKIVNDVNTYNNITLKDMINQFSETICSVANPLFEKSFPNNRSNTNSSQKDQFDTDYIAARNTYKHALSIYNRDKSYDNIIELCDRKRFYKNLIHRKKRSFTLEQAREFESLKRQRPKDFWSFLCKKKQSHGANIPIEDFQNYFSSLFTDIRTTINDEVEHLNENSDFNTNNPT